MQRNKLKENNQNDKAGKNKLKRFHGSERVESELPEIRDWANPSVYDTTYPQF